MRHPIGVALILAARLTAQSSGAIEGRVTNPTTGAGIVGVEVGLIIGGGENTKTTTDTSGSYRFPNMPEGNYGVVFVKEGWYRTPDEVDSVRRFHLKDGAIARVDAMMLPYLTLRGRVFDADGKPVANAQVLLTPPPRGPEYSTDADGRFEFQKLTPAVYHLQTIPAPGAVRTYYPSVVERSLAEPILLNTSTESREFDIHVRTPPLHHVSGIVYDESGKPAANATLRLVGSAPRLRAMGWIGNMGVYGTVGLRPAQRFEEARTTTKADGRFEFLAVAPGDWRIQAMSAPRESIETRNVVSGGGLDFSMSGGDIQNLEIPLAPPFDLEVVSDLGKDHPQKLNVERPIDLLPLDGQPLPAGFEMSPARYSEIVPGRYRVSAFIGSPPGFYLAAVVMGTRDVLDQEIELTANTPPLIAIFKPTTSVRVKVEKGDGSVIVLVPMANAREVKRVPTIRSQAMTGEVMELKGIAPGDYAVAVFDRVERLMFEGEMVLNGIVASATPLHVDADSNSTIELRVSHWAW